MFVEYNNRILDQDKIQRQIVLLKNVILYEFSDIIKKYGFEENEDKFICEELALEIDINFNELC